MNRFDHAGIPEVPPHRATVSAAGQLRPGSCHMSEDGAGLAGPQESCGAEGGEEAESRGQDSGG